MDSFRNNYLWFSKPGYFNDPFDCNMKILKHYDEFLKAILTLGEDAENIIVNNTKDFGICCFTSSANNTHMWSHYGQQHKGLCLEYDSELFDEYFSNMLMTKCHLLPVEYRDKPINLDEPIELMNIEGTKILKPIRLIITEPKSMDSLFEKILTQKQKETWGNEDEQRLIIGALARKRNLEKDRGKGYRVPIKRGMITSVIFGVNTSDEDKLLIREIFDNDIIFKETELDTVHWKIKTKQLKV